MSITISFLGGVGTVTGSKYLVQTPDARLLVDCGLFQGFKQLRLRNWAAPPFDPKEIDAVVLTHAHLDHSGYVPLLAKLGFRGPVICTEPTAALCDILLRDSGFLQEKDAEYANRHGFSKHHPALPLYTREDAENSLTLFRAVPFGKEHPIAKGTALRFAPAGHILGAAIVELNCGGLRLVFSGDLGRPGSSTMVDPAVIGRADFLLVESTYGNRRHDRDDPERRLGEMIARTASRGGTLLVPAFAVGRTQSLLHMLARLKASRRIPDIPIYLDSPMAAAATDIFHRFRSQHRLTEEECRAACTVAHYVRDVEESKSLDATPVPKVIISASGMATGGRILHHLKRYGPDRRNAILLTGYQAGGTRGASLAAGSKSLKIHGQMVSIEAEVAILHTLSAHADADEIIGWLRGFERPPLTTFVTHGEPEASDALRFRIENELGWSCQVPEQGERAVLR